MDTNEIASMLTFRDWQNKIVFMTVSIALSRDPRLIRYFEKNGFPSNYLIQKET